MQRCDWAGSDPINIAYHDKEWGVPQYDDQILFEFLILEGMQAGLSWITILKKRENYRKEFYEFNAEKIVKYTPRKIEKLLTNPGIIRNKLKVASIIKNAQCYLTIKEQDSFKNFIWQFSDGNVIQNNWKNMKKVPTSTKQSDAMSKALKKKGFSFVGTTICYAYMQAIGMVNDHLVNCFRYQQLHE